MNDERGLFTVARAAGVPIRVHPTFLIVVALALFGALGPIGDGLIWIVIVFGSVLLHELAHALVARRLGATVRDIVLLPIGGVSEIENLPSTPWKEGTVAVAGPLASLVIAATAGLTTLLAGEALTPIDLTSGPLLARVTAANAMLAAFNLLPAFPMDGGRILRALVAQRCGPDTATRIAARVGRAFALLLAAVGLISNVWLVVIAVFIYVTGRAEEQGARFRARVAGLEVRDVMVLPPPAEVGVSAVELDEVRRRTGFRYLPVLTGARVAGVIDVTHPGELIRVPEVEADTGLEPALSVVTSSRAGCAAVVDEDHRYLGLVTTEAIERADARDRPHQPTTSANKPE